MNVRSVLLLVLLGLPALLLLAFGPRGRVAAPPDRTIIRYWEKWSGVEAQAMMQLVERFNETVGAERGIWVEYCAVSNVDQRMLISTAGGDPPDVAGLFDYIVPQFADQGALLPLDDLAAEYGIDLGAFHPIWLDICRYNDTLYALPSTPYTIALYYNRRRFREAGLNPDRPPQTLAELNDYALRLTRRDTSGRIVQLGFTTSPAMLGWWHWVWPCFFDARLWDGRQFHLDTPEVRAALDWITARRTALGNKEVLDFERAAGAIEGTQNAFLAQRLAMVFQGPWVSNWVRKYAPDLDYGVAPFPSVTPEGRHAFASTDVFVIPRSSPHPRQAMIFLAYVLRQDVLEELCRKHCKVSPFRRPGPDFFATHPNPYIRVFDELAGYEDAFGYPPMPTWLAARDETLSLLQTVLIGEDDVGAALRRAQQRMDAVVRDYQKMAAKRRALRE